jgi:hypothetical protein
LLQTTYNLIEFVFFLSKRLAVVHVIAHSFLRTYSANPRAECAVDLARADKHSGFFRIFSYTP